MGYLKDIARWAPTKEEPLKTRAGWWTKQAGQAVRYKTWRVLHPKRAAEYDRQKEVEERAVRENMCLIIEAEDKEAEREHQEWLAWERRHPQRERAEMEIGS